MTKEDRREDLASVLQDVEAAVESLRSSCFPGVYILNGREIVRPANTLEWAQWLETANRHVGEDFVGDFRISTIFMGLDTNYSRSGPPILFETMVFGPPVEYKDLQGNIHLMSESLDYQVRYCTYDEAEEGHSRMCKEIGKLLESSGSIVNKAVRKAIKKKRARRK